MTKKIKIRMIDSDMKVGDIAAVTGENPRTLSVKLSRGNLSLRSIEQIADALNCDVVLRDRETGKIY